MATSGHDKSHDSLDLSEIDAELEDLDRSSESEPTDSLIWEECQADLTYEYIAKKLNINDFSGFEPLTSTTTEAVCCSRNPFTLWGIFPFDDKLPW